MPPFVRALVLSASLVSLGCGASSEAPLFERLDPSATGVTFTNPLAEAASFNIIDYPYYYNGGGVAVGDVDGDERPDLFFTANEQENRLYLNRTQANGPIRFEDVTDQAGVGGLGNWSTGVTMVDVNADGRLDLYVMNVGGYLDRSGRNELFINEGHGDDGVLRFTEQADTYGLDFEGYATHATFFDYDRDGDLDAYLLNHSTHTERTYKRAELVRTRHERAGDRLLRNDATPNGPRFTEVSQEASIRSGAAGYGLSTAVADFNGDGWPDLYIGNDFHENDLLYLNNQDGTFREVIQTAMAHTSTFSMGADAADLDNDGRIDLAVLDMLPDDEAIRKTSNDGDTFTLYELKRSLGYHHQLARNTLQLNRGVATDGVPRFSDIAPLAGTAATDWSWAALFADFDLDGHKDLFITNGIFRRPNDLDYINYVASADAQIALQQGTDESILALLDKMPRVPIPNAAFRNDGLLRFEDVAEKWGLDEAGFSNGAAYADLDSDGDLDLVVNNVNAVASIYENQAAGRPNWQGLTVHALSVALVGPAENPLGVGTNVRVVTAGTKQQVAELMPTRGFQSSVEPLLHFGLGVASTVDTLTVRWPDGRTQSMTDIDADQRLTLRYADATDTAPVPRRSTPLFTVVDDAIPFTHEENDFVDFNREKLMPHKRSTDGPAAAVGDVDGDGLDDLVFGGAKHQAASLLRQQPDGSFLPVDVPAFRADSLAEDVDATLFDADNDGDLDLYVVSGGNEFWGTSDALRDRLYRNDGGTFMRDLEALPAVFANGSVVAPGDYDGDGDLDLFVGSSTTPREYGVIPPSFLLENDGTGRFTDVTPDAAPDLSQAGLLADAVWADFDGDSDLDLAVAGEWMRVRLFFNDGGTLTPQARGATGLWHSLAAADVDADGDLDLIAGNLGFNSMIHAQIGEPARLYVGDLDGDGSTESLLTTVRDGREYPYASLDQLKSQFATLRREYPDFVTYGGREVSELFGPGAMANADVLEADMLGSVWLENDGAGSFTQHTLPRPAQFAPAFSILPGDHNGDGHLDVLLAGNFTGVRPDRGQEAAGFGVLLRGTGRGGPSNFEAVDLAESGVVLPGEVRELSLFTNQRGTMHILAARNNASPLVLRATGRRGAFAAR
ncbi:MAG: VCBS repeat-containing protein [Bacteroidota bacterium]